MKKDFFQKIMKYLFKFVISISLIMNIGLFIILFTPITEKMYGLLKVSSEPRKGDVIVVLSSAFPFQTPNGFPGLSTLARLEKGLELYRAGYADKIIVLGGVMIKDANKSLSESMKERLLLYGVPEEDIILHDDIKGTWQYYDNLMLLFKKYKGRFDFNKALFVTSAEQSLRIKKCLIKKIKEPIIVTSEPYEFYPDWGRRFHLFRKVANEMFVAHPAFYFAGRF